METFPFSFEQKNLYEATKQLPPSLLNTYSHFELTNNPDINLLKKALKIS